MKILGIDPGLRTTGFGIIHKKGNSLVYIASGTVKTPAGAGLPLRLKTIFDGISEIIAEYQPDCAAIEKVFVNVNPQSTLLLGQARGAAISALVASDWPSMNLPPCKSSGRCRPRQGTKKAGSGNGSASAIASRHSRK